MGKIKIGSINCRGLASDNIKRRDVFHRYRSKYDIIILVDTHSEKNIENLWRNEWGGDARFSSFSSQSRDVAVLFKNSFEYVIEHEIIDIDGNYILLDMKLQDRKITLGAIYGANNDNPDFFSRTAE